MNPKLEEFIINYYKSSIMSRETFLLRLEEDYFRGIMGKQTNPGEKTFTIKVREENVEKFKTLLDENDDLINGKKEN